MDRRMQRMNRYRLMAARWLLPMSGSVFLLDGCDPTIQQTVENGIIDTSTALLGSVLSAVVQVITESATMMT